MAQSRQPVSLRPLEAPSVAGTREQYVEAHAVRPDGLVAAPQQVYAAGTPTAHAAEARVTGSRGNAVEVRIVVRAMYVARREDRVCYLAH